MTTTAPRIPREKENDHTAAVGERRREFLHEQTGVDLEDVGRFSFDPGVLEGNIENYVGVAQVPIGLAGPLKIIGEHAQGDFYVPLATTEGTLVASYNRGMRLLRECGGVKATVVEDLMQRAPVFIFDDALRGPRLWRLDGAQIRRHQSGRRGHHQGREAHVHRALPGRPHALPAVIYATATRPAKREREGHLCSLRVDRGELPGSAEYVLSGAIDTDKKHSQINVLLTRGRRVIAEAVIKRDVSGA